MWKKLLLKAVQKASPRHYVMQFLPSGFEQQQWMITIVKTFNLILLKYKTKILHTKKRIENEFLDAILEFASSFWHRRTQIEVIKSNFTYLRKIKISLHCTVWYSRVLTLPNILAELIHSVTYFYGGLDMHLCRMKLHTIQISNMWKTIPDVFDWMTM